MKKIKDIAGMSVNSVNGLCVKYHNNDMEEGKTYIFDNTDKSKRKNHKISGYSVFGLDKDSGTPYEQVTNLRNSSMYPPTDKIEAISLIDGSDETYLSAIGPIKRAEMGENLYNYEEDPGFYRNEHQPQKIRLLATTPLRPIEEYEKLIDEVEQEMKKLFASGELREDDKKGILKFLRKKTGLSPYALDILVKDGSLDSFIFYADAMKPHIDKIAKHYDKSLGNVSTTEREI